MLLFGDETGRGGSLAHKQDQLMVPQVTLAQLEMLLENFIYRRCLISVLLGAMTNPHLFIFS